MAGRMGSGVLGTMIFHPLVNPEPSMRYLVPSLAGGLCRCPSGLDLRSTICGELLPQ